MSRADEVILEAATGARRLTRAELEAVLAHVAQAGFDPDARERAGSRLAGMFWRGRVLSGRDRLPPAEVHYLRHVVRAREWPPDTSLEAYLESIRHIILDPRSGILVSQFLDKGWQLACVRRSEDLQGPGGGEWVMVEYRLATGHWITAFQPEHGLAYFEDVRRRDRRWLRRPR